MGVGMASSLMDRTFNEPALYRTFIGDPLRMPPMGVGGGHEDAREAGESIILDATVISEGGREAEERL